MSVNVHPEAIPEELKTSPRWVNWRQVERNGKITKLPVNPITGDPASCSNPMTWGSFDQAMVRCEGGGVNGIGFQLGFPFVGIDLDKCRNRETGEVEPWAVEIVRRLSTYAEISPSGYGIHLLAKGKLPPGARRKGRIEMYGEGRYFTVTGNHLDGTPHTIEERTHALKDLHFRIFGERRATDKPPHMDRADGTVSWTDAELIEKARQAKNGEKFERLWTGDFSGYPSQSEADLALCMILAFWTRRAPDRIDILFRQSGLFRAKWDERHGAEGQTYGHITIDRAIEQCSEVCGPEGRRENTKPRAKQACQRLALIVVNNRQLRDITAETISALHAENEPPSLFVQRGRLARVRMDENQRPMVETVGELELRPRVAQVASYVRLTSDGRQVECPPPHDLLRNVLGLGEWSFPPLEGIVEAPILRPDGTLLDRPGYDSKTHLLYFPADGLQVPAISRNPSSHDVADARELVDEAIGEFPFVDEASRANALGLLLTPVVRPAIRGLVPMACIDAPQAGTGKDLLASVVSLIGTGREAGSMSAPRNEDEWRKRITATLCQGSTFIVIDNVDDELRSSSLASALTAHVWKDRILGQSAIVAVSQRATWVANGNNLRLGGDIPRRCFWIRLDAKTSRPWKRTGFAHPELIPWVFENRGSLLAALLTIAVSWFAAGKPPATSTVPVIGSFEGWARTIGGILDHAGVLDPGSGRLAFLANLEEMYELADESTGQWEGFLQVLSEASFTDEAFTAKQLVEYLAANKTLRDALPDELDMDDKHGSPSRRLGKAFSKRVGRRYGDKNLHLERDGDEKGATKWKVVVG